MDIRIPHLGEGADSGSIVNIFVKEGDKVSKDQTLLELENEKAVAPIPATHAGVVNKIYVKVGDKVTVGQAVLSLAESGAGNAGTVTKQAPSKSHAPAPSSNEGAPRAVARPSEDQDFAYRSKSGLPPPASPTVRKIARELGIDLTHVRGSEAGGRIGLQDLKAYVQRLQQSAVSGRVPASESVPAPRPAQEKIDFAKWGPVQRKAVSSLRQKIGQKMLESWTSIPHVTQFDEADVTQLLKLRKKHVDAYVKKGANLTLTPFVMKAVVAALKKYPLFNSSLDEETHEIIVKGYFHIGVAVDTEAGLIVPVVRDADKKNLFQIAQDLEALAEKTRQRKVSLDELKGGTFTISNLGSIGGGHFTPIVNKPEVAILGVGRGALKPVVVKDKTKESVETRTLLPLALSYDHRVVDGADGARFIRALAQFLENYPESEI